MRVFGGFGTPWVSIGPDKGFNLLWRAFYCRRSLGVDSPTLFVVQFAHHRFCRFLLGLLLVGWVRICLSSAAFDLKVSHTFRRLPLALCVSDGSPRPIRRPASLSISEAGTRALIVVCCREARPLLGFSKAHLAVYGNFIGVGSCALWVTQ